MHVVGRSTETHLDAARYDLNESLLTAIGYFYSENTSTGDWQPQNWIKAYMSSTGHGRHFMKSYVYGIQGHWHLDEPKMLDYTFHWYAYAKPSLFLTDQIDLASEESMETHNYVQQLPAGSEDSGFIDVTSGIVGEWSDFHTDFYPNGIPELLEICKADAAKKYTKHGSMVRQGGQIHFTVAIDQRSSGIVLRRLADMHYSPQRALVYVDDVYVGIWSCTDHTPSYIDTRFADNNDFGIPGRFTKGKIQVDIRLMIEKREGQPEVGLPKEASRPRIDYSHIQGFAWTSFHYWVYSIVPPTHQ